MTDTNTSSEQFTQTASTGGTVKDENLTIRGHIDPDKHWIGETLPAASDADTTFGGTTTSAGTSPFPARANHSHANRSVFGIYHRSPPQTINPGNTYLNGFTHLNGRNLLAPGSTQLFQFPMGGVYHIHMNWYASRNGGGFFTGEMNIGASYFNGGYHRYMYRASNFDIPGDIFGFVADHAHFASVTPASDWNIQFRVDHNDVASWSFTVNFLEITRTGDYVSA